MSKLDKTFLGRGWAFPPGFSIEDASPIMVSEEADIQQSLIILLSTRLGERVVQPLYGSNLHAVVFDKLDKTTITFLRDSIESAILYHEPRIKLLDIQVISSSENEGKIGIDIVYLIRSTNTRSNLVFPFYLTEATDLFFPGA
ncbi:MAG TPA: GPW/gp25 family protein [Chryseolinea sp.]|nr:GPW/gp25 family protein [Chryseolinea sp.]